MCVAYLSSVAHIDETAHRMECASATGQEVSTVVWLQEAHKVGTLRLQNAEKHRLRLSAYSSAADICALALTNYIRTVLYCINQSAE